MDQIGGRATGVVARRFRASRNAKKLQPGLITTLDPGDDMINSRSPDRFDHYFNVGHGAIEVIKQCLASSPESILDLPCGYGRVLRWIVAAWPGSSVTACDINQEAVDFCASQFRAKAIYSPGRLRSVDLGKHDLIWSGSLLTHLDAVEWPGLISSLRDALTEAGRLVFTTHGDRGREMAIKGLYGVPTEALVSSYDGEGFAYVDYPGQSGYGISLSSPTWVKAQLEGLGLLVLKHIPAGWDNHQDVWCVQRAT